MEKIEIRQRAAIAAMHSICTTSQLPVENVAIKAVAYADALLDKLFTAKAQDPSPLEKFTPSMGQTVFRPRLFRNRFDVKEECYVESDEQKVALDLGLLCDNHLDCFQLCRNLNMLSA